MCSLECAPPKLSLQKQRIQHNYSSFYTSTNQFTIIIHSYVLIFSKISLIIIMYTSKFYIFPTVVFINLIKPHNILEDYDRAKETVFSNLKKKKTYIYMSLLCYCLYEEYTKVGTWLRQSVYLHQSEMCLRK